MRRRRRHARPRGGREPDRFDARRAFADLRAQVALGPRPAGSEASRRLAARLPARLPGGRFEAVPGGLRNVVGTLPAGARRSWWGRTTTPRTSPGSSALNDGAAGTATVLELARVLGARRPACEREIRFVMFDGEESLAGRGPTSMTEGLRAAGPTPPPTPTS